MKKYLNKNIFFQGDARIFALLLSLLVATYMILELSIKTSLYSNYEFILYNYYGTRNIQTPLGVIGIFILLIFLVISFISICGIFKRKKWATLLSGPFSRMDIRKRELVLMMGCVIGFILIFLLACIRYSIANDILVSYMKGFWWLVSIDVIRIIFISLCAISILFFIDSLTSNMYITLGSIFAIGVYVFAFLVTIRNSFSWSYNGILNKIEIFIREMLYAILLGEELHIYTYKFLIGLLILILVTIICTIITKKLTLKIKIENMSEAFIFNIIRNIVPILLSTLIGMIVGFIIFEWLVYTVEVEVALNQITQPLMSFGIISCISIIAYIIIKYSINILKNKIPKKYI